MFKVHRSRAARAVLLAGGAAATLASTASAAATTVRARDAVTRSCHERFARGAAGTDVTRVTAPATGLIQARLSGRGDWDLGVFNARTRRSIAGSAGFRSNELAEGFVRKGQRLYVQACRYRGNAATARLVVSFLARPATARTAAADTVSVVDVKTPTRADKRRLQGLQLDLTEHADDNSVQVVLHGAADKQRLRDAGFTFTVEIADLAARTRANRQADARYAAAVSASALPSGRTTYRRLADYELELKQLAMQYPALVKPLTLNHKSVLGRDVNGIEIAVNPQNTDDGKAIFLNMGVHHAREWPSSEHAMEWAYDLLTNYGTSDRTTQLVAGDAQHRRADRQRRRLQHLARGGHPR